MSFGFPGAAWFLLLIPVVTLLYFLRLRRRDVKVSSTLLWSRVLEDRRVNSPFQRFRKNLLLLLQILAILFLAAALSEPRHEAPLEIPRTHLLLMDVSASMGAVDGGETRLARAQRLAREYVRALPKGDRGVVIRFAERARVLTPQSDDRDAIERAIADLEVVPAATSIDEALQDAVSIARNLDDALVAVFSDGAFPAWEGDEIPLPVQYVPIATGAAPPSSGIVALSSRFDYSGSARPQIFIEVRNFGLEPVSGVLSIFVGEDLVRAAEPPGLIPPGERWQCSFEADVEGLARVLWEPSGEDALALDNVAWVAVEPRRDISVWYAGEEDFFLTKALAALPGVTVRRVPAGVDVAQVLTEEPRPPDVILWNRLSVERLPAAAAHLFLGGVPREVYGNPEEMEHPPVISWDRVHPANRFISLARLLVERSVVLPPLAGTVALIETQGGALAAEFSRPGSRGIVVGFDPLHSNWPLDLSYSLFLHNAMAHLAGAEVGPTAGVRGEELIRWRMPRGATSVRITRPDGREVDVTTDAEGWISYADTQSAGAYTLSWQEPGATAAEPVARSRAFPVSLLSADESDLTPHAELRIAGRRVAGQATAEVHLESLWPWLLALALVLVLIEWYCYHLR